MKMIYNLPSSWCFIQTRPITPSVKCIGSGWIRASLASDIEPRQLGRSNPATARRDGLFSRGS